MYLTFYGLKDEPFRLTPDPHYLHLSGPHQSALTIVLEAILYRKGLVMVTGPIGTGKTTLVHTALQMLVDYSKQKVPIRTALLFNPTLSRDEFLEMILDEFEVPCPSTSKPRRLAALHEMLLEAQSAGGTAVLFIDEAHLLGAEVLEEIRLLGNADLHREKLLQIVLSGQPELMPLMNRRELSALRQRISARAHLRPLSLPETRAYVAERLHLAGGTDVSLFSTECMEAVHQYTGGVPRLVNLVCDACLSMGFRTNRRVVQTDMVEEVAIGLGLFEPSATEAAEPQTIPVASANGKNMQRSIVDTLIETMKSNRAAILE